MVVTFSAASATMGSAEVARLVLGERWIVGAGMASLGLAAVMPVFFSTSGFRAAGAETSVGEGACSAFAARGVGGSIAFGAGAADISSGALKTG